MKTSLFFIVVSFVFLLSGCSKTLDSTSPKKIPVPRTTPSPITPVQLKSEFVVQPSANGFKGLPIYNEPIIRLRRADNNEIVQTNGKNYIVKAYLDSQCNNLATGLLSFDPYDNTDSATLSNVVYNKAEDIYLGVTGSNITKSCSSKINFMSAIPFTFNVVQGNPQTGTIGSLLNTPILFQIIDADGAPVSNAKIQVDDQISTASGNDGIASLQYRVSGSIGNQVKEAILYFNEIILYASDILLSVEPGAITQLVLEEPTNRTFSVNDVSETFYLRAVDEEGNNVHPDRWDFNFDTFSNPDCTTHSNGEIVDVVVEENPVLDESDNTTWYKLYFFSYNISEQIYIKFTIEGTNISVCSSAVNITN